MSIFVNRVTMYSQPGFFKSSKQARLELVTKLNKASFNHFKILTLVNTILDI